MTTAQEPQALVTAISASALDIAGAIASVADETTGATAAFIGTVRAEAAVPENVDKPVTKLEYEAHTSLAEDKMREIAASAAQRWKLARVTAIHRTGTCELGEATVVIACSAPHRAEALEACHWIIDEIKQKVPIWKREVYSDGSAWVEGSP
ncbi:MAG TPA: molybdenum cofactor biosynthesis protein MoaE [Actinomycetota bacterium]|nr:molybdenum cofactor biosynthesis protein MoaE [Actinomycetota bacterium]